MKTKAFPLPVLLLFCASFSVAQQDFQDWQQKQQNDFDTFKKAEQADFQKFKDKRDSAFVEFLKQEWQAMQLFQGLMPDKMPKPVDVPVTKPQVIPREAILESSKTVQEIQMPMPPLEKPAESIETFLAKLRKEGEPLTFTFFDVLLKVNCDPALKKARLENPINESRVSSFWADLSRSNYEDLIAQVKALKERMQLNDWGYCLLLDKMGQEIYPASKGQSLLFVWFMLAKSGYDAKVGYNEDEVYLLIPAKNVIYGASYFAMHGINYYVVTFENSNKGSSSVYTYAGNYPDAQNLIALNITATPAIRQATEEKQLRFSYGDKEYAVRLKLKKDAIDFYSSYPQTDLEVYFDASLSAEARYSLLEDFKPIIEGKSEIEAANMLLRFVQTAFSYKTDDAQWGREKPLFAEETLFYPYSDCEDRSVLFGYLVRNLLGLEVIGLDYPGHIATAVKFGTDVKGDCVSYGGKKYLICDATYINANIGQCMPRLKDVQPKVIALDVQH